MKAKSAAKEILSRTPTLNRVILKTLQACSDVVGSTLGPGGMSVVIEREENLPPLVTKDGVTVFRSLGFTDPAAHVVMESARDASVRTASEAGDGTTTATILAEALVRNTQLFCANNPKVSPQKVVRTLQKAFSVFVEPALKELAVTAKLGTPEGRARLLDVATISANGDTELAKAVLQCFDLTGDEGNVTLVEGSGASKYEVERIEGYPVFKGYEDSCGKFYQQFINDPGRQMVVLDRPNYILYHGRVNDIYNLLPIFEKLDQAAQENTLSPNVVLVATGFSEVVLAHLATNFKHPNTINVYPVVAPLNQMMTGQYDFLQDLAALSGGRIFDPLTRPVEEANLVDLGVTQSFEAGRFRSTVLGYREELLVLERVDTLKKQLNGDISDLDRDLIKERIGKISGGIAKLKILGSSAGEVRERRDRAEDAVCAVRGAIKHGCLPGGGWALLSLSRTIARMGGPLPKTPVETEVADKFSASELAILDAVLAESILEPPRRLFQNAGFQSEEIEHIFGKTGMFVYNVLEGEYVGAYDGGVLDSLPAVLESLRNSISIASLLGTCGGLVVFPRDSNFERSEARDTADFLRNANVNEADERG